MLGAIDDDDSQRERMHLARGLFAEQPPDSNRAKTFVKSLCGEALLIGQPSGIVPGEGVAVAMTLTGRRCTLCGCGTFTCSWPTKFRRAAADGH
jgi:hypothetical protein